MSVKEGRCDCALNCDVNSCLLSLEHGLLTLLDNGSYSSVNVRRFKML